MSPGACAAPGGMSAQQVYDALAPHVGDAAALTAVEGRLAAPAAADRADAWTVLWVTLAMALASGIGALPFFWKPKGFGGRATARANSMASGVTLAASFSLLYEGVHAGEQHGGNGIYYVLIVVGLVLGFGFISWCERNLEDKDVAMGQLSGSGAKRAVLVMIIMTMHSFAEGLGVGVSWGGEHGASNGQFVSLAIGLHNIPEGLTVALLMVPVDNSPTMGLVWAIVSNLPQPLVAVPAFMFVETFRSVYPVGVGAAAGAMIFMVFAELIPDALRDNHISASECGHVVTFSVSAMVAFQLLLESMKV